LSALGKGDAAFFAAGSLEFTSEDPYGSAFSRGTHVNSQTEGLALQASLRRKYRRLQVVG